MIREGLLDHMKLKLRLEYEKSIHVKEKIDGRQIQGEGKELERPEGEELLILKK